MECKHSNFENGTCMIQSEYTDIDGKCSCNSFSNPILNYCPYFSVLTYVDKDISYDEYEPDEEDLMNFNNN